MQMKYDDEFNFGFGGSAMDKEVEFGEFKDLGFAFRELGLCMMELGLCLARVCDQQIGGCELEQSLLQSGTAKGRLIHYHYVADNAAINEAENRRRRSRVNLGENRKSDCGDDGNSRLWQQWHYDYGIFTILTTPMFMLSNGSDERECDSPSGHTYLQVFLPEMNRVVMVKAPRGSFIVQPAWSKTFSLANYPEELLRLGGQGSELCDQETCSARHESNGLAWKIQEIVPPLSSRLRDGMTFVEFAKETTKQYYGGKGLQANR
ncbi:hypothetical protein SASPL_137661 [Salvia splendens]|uniref:Uncharacterized protein n=1 Tax=Salvia splendens TaxID=180675 RepID=A0A8X8WVD8_SALSN|nr:hypothetical protein SASPL_137661 [Salvia splendens]